MGQFSQVAAAIQHRKFEPLHVPSYSTARLNSSRMHCRAQAMER